MSGRAVIVRVTGRVQGVGFRYWALEEAEALGLRGWVRNEPDGSVKALLTGPDDAVENMLERLRQGPRGAAVADVATEPAGPVVAPADFRIVR
ncbi:acylphosphatase [Mesorhizobium sp. SP-1A]|uniref:acylphosphatase n=1 Tax=Mesorhizobium sp. SP-1A TaxID=3077840 RepID=UPI0028F729DA|nr:acylphosphatase [Mesorhizobium sp. SP-1A]